MIEEMKPESTLDSHPKSKYGLDQIGLGQNTSNYWNLNRAELYEEAIKNQEAILSKDMAIRVLTGKYTGRSPKDRFVVEEQEAQKVDWNAINQPISAEAFDRLHNRVAEDLKNKKLYVKDAFVGNDKNHRLPVRVISETAYHQLFVENMFVDATEEELKNFEPGFTVLVAPHVAANPEEDETRTETFITLSFSKKLLLVGGSLYSGEVKKGIFTVMNYLLPQEGVMPMHCSANIDDEGETAIYFGLSGTGKTTLSADSSKTLIGDDEHGWTDDGIFNFEGGCYAKTIDITPESEPEIYATTKMPGTILENVPLDENRDPDFFDDSITKNTRASYPIEYIPNASETGLGSHPKNIIFLAADAFGILPPIAKLTPEQTMFHFISGYTAKLAGTERGVDSPQATFSACFGAPFMPMHPTVYAEMLADKIRKHGSNVWLVNTGWTGGEYGEGHRMELKHTRKLLTEATAGHLDNVEYVTEPVFGLSVPKHVEGVPDEILLPRNTWADPQKYDEKARELAKMFKDNFEQYKDQASEEIINAGPQISVEETA